MARTNTKGNSFGGLGLTKAEETKLKKHLVKQGNISLKFHIRFLIRKYTLNGK